MKIKSEKVRLRVVSADIRNICKGLTNQCVELYDVDFSDELTSCFTIRVKDKNAAMAWLNQKGAKVAVITDGADLITGIAQRFRPVLVVGIIVIIILSVFLSGRVLFVRVEGNRSIPANQILETAASCGVVLGAKSKEVRSERVKNQLLEELPDLQWAGVNMIGSVAVIRIEEKAADQEPAAEKGMVTSIVAYKDGVVDSVTVTSGSSVCSVGQVVTEGQLLISGYTDCGLVIKAESAKGEVFAKTLHEISAITPGKCHRRTEEFVTDIRYSLKIGKKLIIFNKGSGISPGTCVKMYKQSDLKLPGGFVLPISLLKETTYQYNGVVEAKAKMECPQDNAVETYLISKLVAGQILRSDSQIHDYEDYVELTGKYLCSEMIGRAKIERAVQGVTNSD